MPFPKTLDELRAANYVFEGPGYCRGCKAPVEWWRTPAGKKMPMDADAKGNCVSHWSTCPNADDFRNRR